MIYEEELPIIGCNVVYAFGIMRYGMRKNMYRYYVVLI